MQYSTVVEPVGIHSLAETNPDDYNKELVEFNKSLKQCISRVVTKGLKEAYNLNREIKNPEDSINTSTTHPKVTWCFNGSHAFVQSNMYWVIYDFLKELRYVTFTEHGFLFRAVFSKTDIKMKILCGETSEVHVSDEGHKRKKTPDAEITSYCFELSADALRILGELNRLKTAGIHADKTLDSYVTNRPNESKRYFVKNYFPTGKFKLDFETYFDIPIDNRFLEHDTGWEKLIGIVNKSRFIDAKLPKYYVGFMANCVRHLDLSKGWADSMYKYADGFITNGKLSKYNNISGIDLVYATLIDKVFSPKLKENKFNSERIQKNINYFILNRAVQKLIAKEKWRSQIPQQVLSNESWHHYVSNLVSKNIDNDHS